MTTDRTAHERRLAAKARARQRRADRAKAARAKAAKGHETPGRVLRDRIDAAEFVRDWGAAA